MKHIPWFGIAFAVLYLTWHLGAAFGPRPYPCTEDEYLDLNGNCVHAEEIAEPYVHCYTNPNDCY